MNTTSSRSLALVPLFAALLAVLGLIPKIDLPLGVPITPLGRTMSLTTRITFLRSGVR